MVRIYTSPLMRMHTECKLWTYAHAFMFKMSLAVEFSNEYILQKCGKVLDQIRINIAVYLFGHVVSISMMIELICFSRKHIFHHCSFFHTIMFAVAKLRQCPYQGAVHVPDVFNVHILQSDITFHLLNPRCLNNFQQYLVPNTVDAFFSDCTMIHDSKPSVFKLKTHV